MFWPYSYREEGTSLNTGSMQLTRPTVSIPRHPLTLVLILLLRHDLRGAFIEYYCLT